MAAPICQPPRTTPTSKITNYGWSTNILLWSKLEQLGQVRAGRAQLPVWITALLRCIVNGGARRGLDGFIEEPDRSVGVDLLLDLGLIVPTRRGYRPSDQVLYSLRLAMWRW